MTPRTAQNRNGVLVAAALSVALIGLLDATLGSNAPSVVFYLLPVAAATVLASTWAGYALAAASAGAWVFADTVVYNERDLLVALWSGVLRAMTISVVVFLLGALRSALIEAAASRQRTEDFLATAAHQLRTPIAGLRASAEALAVEVDPDRRGRLTNNLVDSSDRTGRLLTSLLRLSHIDRVPATEELGAADLAGVCRAETESAGLRFPEIRFECHGPDSLHVPVSLPAIGEAIANLLENAGRHAVARVRLDLRTEIDQVIVEVSDDGPGVPPGMEHIVFDRFVSVDGLGGCGLGLPIARGLIESQHGGLHYAGTARFRATLPISGLSGRPTSTARANKRLRSVLPYPTRRPRGHELQ